VGLGFSNISIIGKLAIYLDVQASIFRIYHQVGLPTNNS